ncbi:MAG: isopeptide-forming domain-containing fimbrial protein [Chloroflexi bacterium]|nr:isopeptide-forming domain-containing fimbrial protein [Chloroflexota bacterium]
MKRNKIIRVMIALLALAVLITPMSSLAYTNTVNLHKLKFTDQLPPPIANDGKVPTALPPGASPLEGAVFAYWLIPLGGSTLQEKYDALASEEYADYADVRADFGTETGVLSPTNSSGLASITLPDGLYIFAEKVVPAYIWKASAPFILSLPAVDQNGDLQLTVDIYPKNVEVRGSVVLTKTAGDGIAVLEGAHYSLHMRNPEDGSYPVYPGMGDLVTNEYGHIVVNNLPYGDYYLVETMPPDGYAIRETQLSFSIISSSMVTDTMGVLEMTGTPAAFTQINASAPTVDKYIGAAHLKEGSYVIGETFTWYVTPEVPPDIASYTKYVFSDTIDPRLSVVPGSWRIYVDNVDVSSTWVVSGHLSVTLPTIANDYTGVFEFTASGREALSGTTLVCTWLNTINENAVMGEPIYNNAYLTYNNGYMAEDGTMSTQVLPYVWTGGYNWVKVDGGVDDVTPLPGAKFKISLDGGTSNYLKWNQDLIEANPGVAGAVSGQDVVLTSDTSGNFGIRGLAGKTYYLIEIEAPPGYNALTAAVPFTVTTSSYSSTLQTRVQVVNNTGPSIPATGGIGTALFTIVGVALMSCAVLLRYKTE